MTACEVSWVVHVVGGGRRGVESIKGIGVGCLEDVGGESITVVDAH